MQLTATNETGLRRPLFGQRRPFYTFGLRRPQTGLRRPPGLRRPWST